jgi:hypothetical protein
MHYFHPNPVEWQHRSYRTPLQQIFVPWSVNKPHLVVSHQNIALSDIDLIVVFFHDTTQPAVPVGLAF